ncbi:STAS domain-containing protein [Sulfitobacter sp. S190]|uniref:STAS domain-containing protein n=1 Tax=Sulfitobacter sp. S190 TaxID=2867022 RepID=UPI0021A5A1B8|nr:STAS domain-containing protein [Sulfitobacter sp. S190]UWR22230.1 STAS domain-containing protein [Sulfitobacter sp. S190]
MELISSKEPQAQVIAVREDRIDAAVALAFKDRIRELTAGETDPVLLDLTQVGFIDSSGLGAIVAAMKHLAPQRSLMLAGLTPSVERVFRLTRMDSVFEIHTTVEMALSSRAA